MHQASYLLQLLLSLLSARGLAAQAVDAWRGWVTFKQYARIIHEVPDPGVSVQITPERGSDEVRLVSFVRSWSRVGTGSSPWAALFVNSRFGSPTFVCRPLNSGASIMERLSALWMS